MLQTQLLGAQLPGLPQKKGWESYPGSETWGLWVPIYVLSKHRALDGSEE